MELIISSPPIIFSMVRYRSIFLFNVYIFLLFSSCSITNNLPKYDKIGYQICFETAQQLQKTKNLQMDGFGAGKNKFNEQSLSLSLTSNQSMNIEQARILLLDCVHLFLENINKNEKFRPYLKTYPFKAANVEITIISNNPDNYEYFPPPSLASCYISNGKLFFNIKKKLLETIHKETYEEALKIVQNENGINN